MQIIAAHSDKCLSAPGQADTQLTQQTCVPGAADQLFDFGN